MSMARPGELRDEGQGIYGQGERSRRDFGETSIAQKLGLNQYPLAAYSNGARQTESRAGRCRGGR
jgi:hypothetical protein